MARDCDGMDAEATLKPGRLSITCIDAQNIRSRADAATDARGGTTGASSAEQLSVYLLFRLNGTERTSRTGRARGHDALFGDEVIEFDLPSPENSELIIEVCDDESNASVGQAPFPISKALTSGKETLETLPVTKLGDTSTNSAVRLKFSFVRARTGVIKLALGGVENLAEEEENADDIYATVSTPEGRTERASLSDPDAARGFWMGPENWFGDLTVRLHRGDACLGGGKLRMLSCHGSEIRNSTSRLPMIPSEGEGPVRRAPIVVVVRHWFLEAGVVRVRGLRATDLRDASLGATGLTDPRVIVKSSGKARATAAMTEAAAAGAEAGSYRWDDAIRVPVVDEHTLTLECAEVDEATGEREPIGAAELSLLPLFKTGRLEAAIDLKHVTEVSERMAACLVNSCACGLPRTHLTLFAVVARGDVGWRESPAGPLLRGTRGRRLSQRSDDRHFLRFGSARHDHETPKDRAGRN